VSNIRIPYFGGRVWVRVRGRAFGLRIPFSHSERCVLFCSDLGLVNIRNSLVNISQSIVDIRNSLVKISNSLVEI
jgi:hypothetical protein